MPMKNPRKPNYKLYRGLLGVSKVFVLIEKAMYRTLLATCGSAEMLAH